jgi:hypothetical protein
MGLFWDVTPGYMNSLLRDLAVVSELKSYQKLDFHDGPYPSVSKIGIRSGLKRLLFGDSRETTFSFLDSLYGSAHEITELLLESNRLADRTHDGYDTVLQQMRTLLTYVSRSTKGLTALRQTYGSDETANARLTVIALRASKVLGRIEQELGGEDGSN